MCSVFLLADRTLELFLEEVTHFDCLHLGFIQRLPNAKLLNIIK